MVFTWGKGVSTTFANTLGMKTTQGMEARKRKQKLSLSLHSSWSNLSQNMMKLEALKRVKPWIIIIITIIIQNSNLHLYSSWFFPNNIIFLLWFAFHDTTVPILRWRAEPQGNYNLSCITNLTNMEPGFKCRFHNSASSILSTWSTLK